MWDQLSGLRSEGSCAGGCVRTVLACGDVLTWPADGPRTPTRLSVAARTPRAGAWAPRARRFLAPPPAANSPGRSARRHHYLTRRKGFSVEKFGQVRAGTRPHGGATNGARSLRGRVP